MSANFCDADLRGKSFRGQNLAGANFRGADIRGADFTNARLRGADFRYVKAGLPPVWSSVLLALTLLLSAGSGLLAGAASAGIGILLTSDQQNYVIAGGMGLIVLAIFMMFALRKGIGVALSYFAGAVLVVGAGTAVLAGISTVTGAGTVAEVLACAIAIAFAVAFASAVAFTIAVAIAGAIAGALAVTLSGAGFIAVAILVAGCVATSVSGLAAGFGAVVVTIGCSYIGWRSLADDNKHHLIRRIAIAVGAIWGTQFRGADLTDADFSHALLKSTDFSHAMLTNTYWLGARKLDRARPGKTYLRHAKVRRLVIAGQTIADPMYPYEPKPVSPEPTILMSGTQSSSMRLRV